MRNIDLTPDEIYGLIEAVDKGHDDQENYLKEGNPDTDYGEEWPEVARDKAGRWRNCASALRKIGLGEFETLALCCESLASSLDASAAEYRNPEVGN